MARKKPQKDTPKPGKKSRKKSGIGTIVVIALATVIAGIIVLSYLAKEKTKTAKTPGPAVAEKERDAREVNVYFSDEEGLNLKAEKRKIKKGTVESEARGAIEALIEGPKNSSLGKTIPDGARLLGIKIKDRTAVADFNQALVKNHPGGSSGEIQTVYSIVDTLALNFPEIKDVRILVNGKKQETLAGHIDISYPVAPDRKIIKE